MATLVKYKYLGLSTIVEVDYPTPQVKLSLYAAGSPPTYPGLDRFGRVINHPWIDYGQTPNVDVARIQHGYDRNSNRLWRQNDVARSLDKKFDQQYTYDGLNRLTDAKTGLLNGSHVIPPGSDTRFQQQWSLDYVGNWSNFKQDDDGSGTFGLEQTRTANPVNEITNIAATAGPTWTTPQYDRAGNTTSFPKPAAPTESFTAIYDAWNRMVRVIDNETSNIVQENVYDGRNFRIIKKTYAPGSVLDETRHIYYTSNWQAIEERLGTDPDSADAAQQYVWGLRYIDDLVLRDRNTSDPPNGILDERLYAIQDPNWNVTTIIDDSGDVQERYEYQAYGETIFLDNNWDQRAETVFQWCILYAGYLCDLPIKIYLTRRRILHPILGSWQQRDPDGYTDGFSLYEYVKSCTPTHVDPFGTSTFARKPLPSFMPAVARTSYGRGCIDNCTQAYMTCLQRGGDSTKCLSKYWAPCRDYCNSIDSTTSGLSLGGFMAIVAAASLAVAATDNQMHQILADTLNTSTTVIRAAFAGVAVAAAAISIYDGVSTIEFASARTLNVSIINAYKLAWSTRPESANIKDYEQDNSANITAKLCNIRGNRFAGQFRAGFMPEVLGNTAISEKSRSGFYIRLADQTKVVAIYSTGNGTDWIKTNEDAVPIFATETQAISFDEMTYIDAVLLPLP